MFFTTLALVACKNDEKKAEEITNEFLTIINSENYKSELLNKNILTKEYKSLVKNNYFFTSTNWTLRLKSKNDSIIIVESKSHTTDEYGTAFDLIQLLYLKNENKNLKIYDSSNLVTSKLDFEILGVDFGTLSDIKKHEIFKHIKENLSLQIIVKGHKIITKHVEGEIRITNNSKYDIKGLNLLNEHFNNKGISVNTDRIYIDEILRKKSYRDKYWLTSDCGDCDKQKITINFISED